MNQTKIMDSAFLFWIGCHTSPHGIIPMHFKIFVSLSSSFGGTISSLHSTLKSCESFYKLSTAEIGTEETGQCISCDVKSPSPGHLPPSLSPVPPFPLLFHPIPSPRNHAPVALIDLNPFLSRSQIGPAQFGWPYLPKLYLVPVSPAAARGVQPLSRRLEPR
jgi:hypothetical protein